MKYEVPMLFEIHSTIGAGEERETVSTHARGTFRTQAGVHTLSFAEAREGGRVFTTLTFRPGSAHVHMKCRGGVKSEIIFDLETPHFSVYETASFRFDLTVRSLEVKASLDENGGEVCISYIRDIGGDSSPVLYRLYATPNEGAVL